jgi:hypothetical protein
MNTATKKITKKPSGQKSKYKMGVVFAKPRSDNSASTQQNRRNLENPPMYYFYGNQITKLQNLVDVTWKHDDVLVAIIYDTESKDALRKYTAEKQWNHAFH